MRQFLQTWEEDYDRAAQSIAMFDPTKALDWTPAQKQLFARMLYHARGHFYRFLWFLGSTSTSKAHKDVILANIRDEFGIGADGVNRRSHEELYWDFAAAVGLDRDTLIRQEIVGEATYSMFIQRFNRGHIRFILKRPWDEAWAAFCAYERLDNLDYENLYRLAVRLGVSGEGLLFYEVHREVEHYENANPLLEEIWERDPDAVRAGFAFIASHQLKMWQTINALVAMRK